MVVESGIEFTNKDSVYKKSPHDCCYFKNKFERDRLPRSLRDFGCEA